MIVCIFRWFYFLYYMVAMWSPSSGSLMASVSSLSSPLSKQETISAIRKNEQIFSLSRQTPSVQGKWILERLLQSDGWLTLARPSTLLYFCCRERGLQSLSCQTARRFSQLCFCCKLQKTVNMVKSWSDNFLCQKILEENGLKNQSLSCLLAKSSQSRESTAKYYKHVPNSVVFKKQEN